MGTRHWTQSYADIPAEIDADRYASMVDLLDAALERHASRPAFKAFGQTLNYADVDRLSRSFASYLQNKLGVRQGDRVAVMMPNLLAFPVTLLGIMRAGAVQVNVNPLYTPRELEHQLNDAGVETIVVFSGSTPTLAEVRANTGLKTVITVAVGDASGATLPSPPVDALLGESVSFAEALAQGGGLPLQPVALTGDDLLFLQYTGGTTGLSKGATLLHRNVVANVLQTEAWFNPMLKKVGHRQLNIVCALPLYHIFALTVCYFMGLRMGGCNLLIPNPRDIPGLVATLARHRIHMFPAVNTLYNALANDADFARLDFSELVVSNGGGMAVQQATAEKWLKITGCPVCEGYGLSETSPVATANRLDLHDFTGSIGLPIPSTEIAIRDDDGRDQPIGERGEICIRGPQVMAGYWQRPEETAQVLSADGWFKTGDIGIMDERGYVRIVDRKKDMILVSGFNVYPTEIEQVVNLHPGVLECAAVGVPDAHSGEAVKLFVVKSDPALDEEDIARWCHENFTGYKRPKYIDFRDDLPKSNVGKILRRELRS